MKRAALLLLLIPATLAADSKIVRISMGGDLKVRNAPFGATLRTMGGNIRVDRAGGVVVAQSMGGNIRVRGLDGSVNAGTLGGNVEVEVLGGGTGRSIHISSLGGHLEVTVPKDFAAEFEITLEQDDDDRLNRIHSDVPLQIVQSRRRHWFKKVTLYKATAVTGSGANHVRMRTIGGDITIRRR